MKLHLVFDLATSGPLTEALRARGYEVSGTDTTLEQFALAAESGQITADLAIVDVTAGIVRKQDSVKFLRAIRGHIPDMRLITVLPDKADMEWVGEIGALGIYDVYPIEEFTIDDVIRWIQTRKTIRDLGDVNTHLTGQVPKSKKKRFVKSDSFFGKGGIKGSIKKITANLIDDEDIEDFFNDDLVAPRVVYRMIGSRVIAVGGLHRRAGTTHTAIQLAVLLSQNGLKTALAEYRADERASDLVWIKPTDGQEDDKFGVEGIDVYPDLHQVSEVLSRGYDAIVLDVGTLDVPAALDEWRRASVRAMTLSAAPWDIGRVKLSKFKDDQASIVVNFADRSMYEAVYELLKHHEKSVVHNRGGYDPFNLDLSLMPVISAFFPEKKRRKVF
jgi:hypothetical protein